MTIRNISFIGRRGCVPIVYLGIMIGVVDDNKQTRRTLKRIFGGLAGLLWVLALGLSAYSDGTTGGMCLFFGWIMISDNTFAFLAWFSNIPFLIGVLLFFFGKTKTVLQTATLLFALAVLLSFGALTLVQIENGEGVPVVVHATIGTYVWMLSCIVMLIGALLSIRSAKPKTEL